MSQYKKTCFVLSCADLKQLPPDEGLEVAFVGRSNSGKSSVLNQVTQSKQLARVSKTPGRTQHINVFKIDENRRLMDLPGYGYAKVPEEMRKHWGRLLPAYLSGRKSLQGLILVMDIRHPFKEVDNVLLNLAVAAELPVHILFNKSDKFSRNQLLKAMSSVKQSLTTYGDSVSFQSFSAIKGAGVEELYALLNQWFAF